MDQIEIKVVEEPLPDFTVSPSVQVLVNGVDLWELVVAAERRVNALGGDAPEAGYRGLWAESVFLPSRRLLGEPVEKEAPFDEDGLITLLGCECGYMDCWPLAARIVIGPSTVRWQDVRHPRQRGAKGADVWANFQIGPFEFDRRQYEKELAKEWKHDRYPRLKRSE